MLTHCESLLLMRRLYLILVVFTAFLCLEILSALDSSGPVTTAAIKSWTDKDQVVSRVKKFVLHGNWDSAPKGLEIVPYWQREHE